MAKGYWVSIYRNVKEPEKLAAYAKIAAPASPAAGGRFIVRTPTPVKVYEAGIMQRTVIVEFDSVDKAIATHDGAAYQEALRVLGDGVERDFRVCEGA